MKKFGGPGRMKQSCVLRQCLAVSDLQGIWVAGGEWRHQRPCSARGVQSAEVENADTLALHASSLDQKEGVC